MALMQGPLAERIAGVSLTTADAAALAAFYGTLGFELLGEVRQGGEELAALMHLHSAEARVLRLALGAERLELVEFAERGRPYPRDAASNDPRFQHFAIVVSSMGDAYDRLRRTSGWFPITQRGPQRLPQSSGGVVAFKFRDPEGHPLELLEFPEGRMPEPWRTRWAARGRGGTQPPHEPSAGPCLGIDHSAIVVGDTGRSLAFYGRLGLTRSGGSLNHGPEQAQLDDLPEPEVEVTALSSPCAEPPHLELLCYREPTVPVPLAAPLASNDIAASRLLLEVPASRPRLAHDPDGHALLIGARA